MNNYDMEANSRPELLTSFYDNTAEQDAVIIHRVAELAEKHGVTMTEVSLAWLLTKRSRYPEEAYRLGRELR